ncbi:hypothetical protein [Marinobacterium stanieri]|uniref:hypothetical protein n=1 Tax=Marinobacterium stanieri TaxID=49186 RepID=UPI0011123BB4|nr:hypothetical protein [Marinobacterium stanieri]
MEKIRIHGPVFLPKTRTVTKSLVHWNYFLSLENDYINFSRFLEFCSDNYDAYSIETGRLLMAATQECDVLLKQLSSNGSSNESGYRSEIPSLFSNFTSNKVVIPRFNLEFQPFESWGKATPITPEWWTANNKFKHQRHERFNLASLKNALNAVSALLLCNIYFYHKNSQLNEIQPTSQLFIAEGLMASLEPTQTGLAPNYRV